MGSRLPAVMRRAGAAAATGSAGPAAAAWPRVVGEAAAAHSAPVRRTRAGVLTVACSSSAWAHELSMRRDELLALLTERCPEAEVSGLRFSVADHALAPPQPAPPRPAAPSPTAAQRAAARAEASAIADPALRDLVARAAAASAARRGGSGTR
ncbi:MAG: DciA family protein [Thermoleophilia bacterium]